MPAGFSALLGESPALVGLRTQLEHLVRRYATARRLPPVLLLGETGTGKSLVARTLHEAGPRARGPFVDVACPAIPDTLMEAQMFGVERGAFTDAKESKPGLFTAADRGTIFLDEVGLLSDTLQAKLLKVVEDQQVRPLGATVSKPVDVWIIAATSEDLQAAVRKRRFREDLYFRLAVVTVNVPPLRERGDDVVLLAHHLLARACADYALAPKTLAPAAVAALRAQLWDGNIRQLGNVIERVALHSEAPVVTAQDLGFAEPVTRPAPSREASEAGEAGPGIDDAVAAFEWKQLSDALAAAGGNVTRAARSLGLTRNTFRYRWRKLRPMSASGAAPSPVAAPPAPVPASRWERRRLAFLRVAVAAAGEEVEHKQRVLLQEVLQKLDVFAGTLDSVSPGGITAVFGLDFLDDGPRRAAHAAMAIRKLGARARELDAAMPAMTLAIHAAATLLWKTAGAVHVDGDTRPAIWQTLDGLITRTPPGSIVVSEPTTAALRSSFHLVAAADDADGACLLLDGEATAALPTAGKVFVGRRDEMALLSGRLELASEGRGQVVGIDGDPGIGKSTALSEFQRRLDPARMTHVVGRCVSHGRNLPLLPVIDLVRGLSGTAEHDDAAAIRTRLRSTLTALGMPADEMIPYLMRLMGLSEGSEAIAHLLPEALHQRTLEIFCGFVLASSRAQPLVLFVEDLHWIDRASEGYLTTLVDLLVDASMLLVTTTRPGYHPPWSARSYVINLKLQPLGRADARRILDTAVERDAQRAALSAATAEAILDRADGNPFFIEELVTAMGSVPGGAVAVPESIEAVLLARIDRLADPPKRVLQAAAVLGRDVPTPLLEAMTTDIVAPAEHLRELQRLEYLHDRSDGANQLYRFKHALTQEVAYGSLLPEDRRALHAHVVATLEARHARQLDEQAETLGHHAMRGQLWDKAARYLRQTGVKAFERYALHEAAACLEQTLEALAHLPAERSAADELDIRIRLCSVLAPWGQYRRALEHAAKAAQIAEARGERRQLGIVLAHQCVILRIVGETDAGFAAGHRALAIATELGDRWIAGQVNYGFGIAHHTRGRFRQAAACYRESILHGEAVYGSDKPFPRWMTGALAWLTWTLECLGEFKEGLVAGRRAIETAEAQGDRLLGVAAYLYLAVVHLGRGDRTSALPLLERALAQCRAYRADDLLGPVSMRLGLVYCQLGRIEEGIALGEEGMAHFNLVPTVTGLPTRLAAVAESYLLAGRSADSEDTARRGLALAREHHQPWGEAACLRVLGLIAAASTPPDTTAAETYFTQARDLAADLEMRPFVAHCNLDLARLWSAAGRRAEACEHLALATETYRTLDMPGWLTTASAEAEKLGLASG